MAVTRTPNPKHRVSTMAPLLYLYNCRKLLSSPATHPSLNLMNRLSLNTLNTNSPPSLFINNMATTTLRERMQQSITPDALRAYLAEFISTFIFVFAVVGSTMSSQKMMPNVAVTDPACLVAVAVASAFGLSCAVYIAANISGGHVNPAVTFGKAVGGHISVLPAIFYWISQLLGSVMACFLLKLCTAGNAIPTHAIAEEMTGFGAAVMEGVMTFTLVYTVYAGDPRRGSSGIIGPLAIGFIVGANILAAGPFTGGSMNPACSFGSAMVSGNFKNQGVYWAGPLIGAAVAGLLYENVVFPHIESPPVTRGTEGAFGV